MTSTRPHRRLERPREQVLAATLEMVAEEGLAKVTMAALARRLGTSGGHLLYYFGTRNGLLLETLRWSEHEYAVERRPIMEAAIAQAGEPSGGGTPPEAPAHLRGASGADLLAAFAAVYLPLDDRDPRWLLWLELWARAAYDGELAAAQRELDDSWHADLVALLSAVLPDPAGAEDSSVRLRAMWDGFAIAIVTGGGHGVRERALAHTRALYAG